MMRVAPWEEPRSWPGTNRSMPTTRRPRRPSAASAALPMTPRPITATSKDDIVTHSCRYGVMLPQLAAESPRLQRMLDSRWLLTHAVDALSDDNGKRCLD